MVWLWTLSFFKRTRRASKFNIDIQSKLLLSRKAHLILPTHRLLDAASETSKEKQKLAQH